MPSLNTNVDYDSVPKGWFVSRCSGLDGRCDGDNCPENGVEISVNGYSVCVQPGRLKKAKRNTYPD